MQKLALLTEGEAVTLCERAAYSNHSSTVRWLHAHGFALSATVCYSAIKHCNLPLLQFLIEAAGTTCEPQQAAFLAAIYGDVPLMSYVQKHIAAEYMACPEALQKLLHCAGNHGNLAVLQHIHCSLDAPLPGDLWSRGSVMDLGADKCWPLQTLQWAVANGARFGSQPHPGTCAMIEKVMQPLSYAWAHTTAGCPCDCSAEIADIDPPDAIAAVVDAVADAVVINADAPADAEAVINDDAAVDAIAAIAADAVADPALVAVAAAVAE